MLKPEEWKSGMMEVWNVGIFTTEALRTLRKKKLGMEGWNDGRVEELVTVDCPLATAYWSLVTVD